MAGSPSDVSELRSVLAADYARNANRSVEQRLALLVIRVGQYANSQPRRRLLFWTWRIVDLMYLRWMLGAEIHPNVQIGPGLAIPHAARGLIIHGGVVIGRNAMIHHRVTIGPGGPDPAPRLGDDAFIGPGTVIVGPIFVGSRVRIGANAVVSRDLPDGAIAFGVPARVLRDDR